MATDSKTQQAAFLKYSHTIGMSTMEGRGYYYPVDTAIGQDGKVYTVNRSLDGDTRGVRVTITDWDEKYYGTFASYGEQDGGLIWPTAIAIDSEGQFFVSDEYTNRVTTYDPDGNYVAHWGTEGTKDGEIDGPSGLAFDTDDNLYVVDHHNNRIQKFTRSGQHISSFSSGDSAHEQLNLPWGIAIDQAGNVYVADWGNDQIQKFSPKGKFIASFGSPGKGDGELHRPAGVDVDSEGNVYVADWGNERVQVFDPQGRFITKLRGEATDSAQAGDFLRINIEEAAARAKSDLEPDLDFVKDDAHEESWHIEKYFWAPTSVTLDRHGRLYVTESNRHRIQMYVRS